MKKILSIALALVLLCSFAMAEGVKFTATDMEGNTVTEAIFADYDLTMVNVWSTWCGYCIEEMPAFPGLKDSLPENVNLITICEDASIETELANLILDTVGANFTTLVGTAEMFYGGMLSDVYAFPTTLFYDSEGRLVGEAFAGVPSLEDPAGAYLSIVEDRLAVLAA